MATKAFLPSFNPNLSMDCESFKNERRSQKRSVARLHPNNPQLMKILILNMPFSGHINPDLPLARKLSRVVMLSLISMMKKKEKGSDC